MLKSTMFSLAAALSIAAVPSGAVTPHPASGKLFALALDTQGLSNSATRGALVRAAAEYCAAVDKAFPRNSPAEETWLNTEIKGGDDRAMRALKSAEFGRRTAHFFVESCNNSVAAYQGARRGKALVGLAYSFHRFVRDASYYAKLNGVDAEALGFDAMGVAIDGFLLAALAEPQ